MSEQYGLTGPERFDAEAEEICLSFANTADWHASKQPEELLLSYGDLLTWARLIGILSREKAGVLDQAAGRQEVRADQVRLEVIRIREAMYRLFVAAAEGRPLPPGEIAVLNDALPGALSRRRLVARPGMAKWAWADSDELEQILWPALLSAADLLTSERMGQVGQCHDDRGCGWLFLDQSRNHSRRWCAMDRCGNRAKAQRYYQRVTGRA
jgi:predicted RNA-binding Zn ribbon-like protein